MASSPLLLAKKAERDEKRKKLQDLMENSSFHVSKNKSNPANTSASTSPSQSGEPSSEKHHRMDINALNQNPPSYQHGDSIDLEEGNTGGSGHIVLMEPDQPPRLLKEEIASLIHNEDAELPDGSLLSRKQKALGAAALFAILYWWL